MSETAGGGGIGPDTPVSAGLVHGLYLAGVIPAGRYLRAVRFARDDAAWALWARRAVLALGVGQVLAGVVFFFAYNWAALPAWAKLGGLQAGIVAAAVAAWVVGLARPVGRALLVGAAVLVGVTLAVFGQIYQTGADAYQLFVGWGLLILPWVLGSASPALWLVWLVVIHLGVELWGMQVAVPEGRVSWAALHAGLAAFDAALLAAREVAAARGVAWIRPVWTRRVLLAMALGLLFAPALREVVEDGTAGGTLAVTLFVAATAGAGAVYARVVPDFAAFALAVLFGCVFLSAVAIDVAALAGAFDVLASWIVTAAIVAIFGAASMLLRAARAAMVGRGHGG